MRKAAPSLGRPLRGTATVPGDKSISHRAAIVAALARGRSDIAAFSTAADCLATVSALRALGVTVEVRGGTAVVTGAGLSAPAGPLDCGRSGTTMRLLAGVLAGRPFRSVLTGDPQLLRRPMERVAGPLRALGAEVHTAEGGRPPLQIHGGALTGSRVRPAVPSAQVKSAILLAGLSATGRTAVVEPIPTRDHTERLLAWLGAPLRHDGDDISVAAFDVPPFEVPVPGDPSSAAFLLAAAAIAPGSDVAVRGVGLNPSRLAFLRVLERMGGAVEINEEPTHGPEPAGEIRVRHAPLEGVAVGPVEAAALIDELPLLAVVATQAEGITEIRGAAELRVKESDRIAGLVNGLRALGATVDELTDGVVITGPTPLRGAAVDALGDHRLAMAFAVAGVAAGGAVEVDGMDRAADSFPGFLHTLEVLT